MPFFTIYITPDDNNSSAHVMSHRRIPSSFLLHLRVHMSVEHNVHTVLEQQWLVRLKRQYTIVSSTSGIPEQIFFLNMIMDRLPAAGPSFSIAELFPDFVACTAAISQAFTLGRQQPKCRALCVTKQISHYVCASETFDIHPWECNVLHVCLQVIVFWMHACLLSMISPGGSTRRPCRFYDATTKTSHNRQA